MVFKVGIVGLGHMQNALCVDSVEVVAAPDKNEKSRRYAEHFHVKTYADYCTLIVSDI